MNNTYYKSSGWTAGRPIILNASALDAGEYEFKIVFDDGLGLSVEDIVKVKVISENATVGPGVNVVAVVIGSIAGGSAGIIGIVYVLKKKKLKLLKSEVKLPPK